MKPRERKSEDEILAAIDLVLQQSGSFEEAAMAALYGRLPDWFPEPVILLVRRSITSLRQAGQSIELIERNVGRDRKNEEIRVPGRARDVDDFIKSVNYLAHVQWALSLGKSRCLEVLAGRHAVTGERLSAQRRAFSEKANEARKAKAASHQSLWREVGEPLRLKYPDRPDTWLSKEISRKTGGRESTIRAALGQLGLKKRKSC